MPQDPTPCSLPPQAFDSHNTALPLEGDDVTKHSGAESSNAVFSFPEYFEGKGQSGEMYQNDCIPLLYTLCNFQRLKVKAP